MSKWLAKIQALAGGMLFLHGYPLPFEKSASAPSAPRRREVSFVQRCARACRAIAQRPRLIQPH